MIPVPFFDYPALYEKQQQRYAATISDVLQRGALILQGELAEFEDRLAAYCDTQFAVGVGNCTDGLSIGLAALGIGAADEVIVPSHTFVASVAAIVQAGATPVLVEVGTDHLIDPAAVLAAIGPRTAAIMPVSLNGRCADLPEITSIAESHGLAVIEDAAQAIGATIDGRMAGTYGDVGAFSFYPAKNLGCFGDGGAVVTDSPELGRFASLYRDHGRNHETGDVELWGVNSRLDNLQAAILLVNLAEYPNFIMRRREIATKYHAALHDIDDLFLPPPPGSDNRRFDTFQNYEIETGRRDELRAFLASRKIGSIVQWGGKAVHQYDQLGLSADLPFTELLFQRMLLLPMNHLLSPHQVDHVIDSTREFFAE